MRQTIILPFLFVAVACKGSSPAARDASAPPSPPAAPPPDAAAAAAVVDAAAPAPAPITWYQPEDAPAPGKPARFPMSVTSATEKVTLVGLNRGKKWPAPRLPSGWIGAVNGDQSVEVPPGHEVVVLYCRVDELPGVKLPTPIGVALRDEAGKTLAKIERVVFSVGPKGETGPTEYGFLVPSGVRLGELEINAAGFRLDSLPARAGKQGRW